MKTMLHFAFSSCSTLGNQHMASACVNSESCSVPPSHAHKPYLKLLYFLILSWSYRTTSKIHIQHILFHAHTFFHFQIGTGTRAVNLTLPLSPSPPCLSPRGDSILSSFLLLINFCTVVIGVPPRRRLIGDPYWASTPHRCFGTPLFLVTLDIVSLFRTCHQRNRSTVLSVRLSLSFFATSSHQLSPRPRQLISPQETRPATSLFGLGSSRPATSLFGLSSTRRPTTSSTSATARRHFAVSLRWCPACNAHPSRVAARRSLSVLYSFCLSLFPNLCVLFLYYSSLSFHIVRFFSHKLTGVGVLLCSSPAHYTQTVFTTFVLYLDLTVQLLKYTCNTFIFIHALSSTFRLAQAPEQSTWLFLSLHRLPDFLLVATKSYLLLFF